MGTLVDIKQIKGLPEMLGTGLVRDYAHVTGTAAVTTSPYWSARYDVTDPEVTEYTDGMKVAIVVPVAGNGSYGTVLQINSLGYKPIVFATSSMISTHYPVGGIIIARYNAVQTAKIYLGSGHQNETVTGCWQVMDYNSDTTLIGTLRLGQGSTPVVAATYRNVLVCTNLDGEAVPLHSTPASASSQYSSTGTNKEMSRELFNPFGLIAYNGTSGIIATDGRILYERMYIQYPFNPQYSFNCGNTLVAGPLYLVAEPAEDGQARLVGKRPCWSQQLPTQYDGLIYILLGHHSGDTYSMLYAFHPVYWHNGDHVCVWSGDENHARDLAPVERGTLASRAYAEGDLMVTGSGLRRATEDIDEEDTISAKTERTTIADEIKRNSKNEVEVSETEPTDPNVEVWIDPQGEADTVPGTKTAKKNIIVHRALPLLTAKAGDRYFFAGPITVKLPYDWEGMEDIDDDEWTDISAPLPGNYANEQNRVFKQQRDYEGEYGYRYGVYPKTVTIPENIDALRFMTDREYMYSMCMKAEKLTALETASPYFEIHQGRIICTKKVVVRNEGHRLRILGKNISWRQYYIHPGFKYVPRKGNGYGLCTKISTKNNGAYVGHKFARPRAGGNHKGTTLVVGIARGKKSIYGKKIYILGGKGLIQ